MDTTGDLVASARQKLLTALDEAGLLGTEVGKDATGGAFDDGWVFPALDGEGRPPRDVKGTGKACVVLHSRNEWNSNYHNTVYSPVLMTLVYADSSRAADGTTTARDAELRARAVVKVVVKTFHDAANVDHDWPDGLYVIHSVRAEGSSYDDVPGTSGLVVRGMTRFEVALP